MRVAVVVELGRVDDLLDGLHQPLQALLDLGRTGAGDALLGDVRDGALEHHAPVSETPRTGALDHLEHPTVAAHQAVGELELRAGAHVAPRRTSRRSGRGRPGGRAGRTRGPRSPRRRLADERRRDARRHERPVRAVGPQLEGVQVQARREGDVVETDVGFGWPASGGRPPEEAAHVSHDAPESASVTPWSRARPRAACSARPSTCGGSRRMSAPTGRRWPPSPAARRPPCSRSGASVGAHVVVPRSARAARPAAGARRGADALALGPLLRRGRARRADHRAPADGGRARAAGGVRLERRGAGRPGRGRRGDRVLPRHDPARDPRPVGPRDRAAAGGVRRPARARPRRRPRRRSSTSAATTLPTRASCTSSRTT